MHDAVGARRFRRRFVPFACAGVAVGMLALSACGGGSGSSSSASGSGGGPIKVALILKEFTNPYWISMENSAKQEAAKLGVDLHVTAGKSDDDTTSQINQIDQAIAAGDKGIIIALNGDAVNTALNQAKSEGLVVVAVIAAVSLDRWIRRVRQ